MYCAIHVALALHITAGATGARSYFVQHATCEFAFSHDFECTSALCKFCKFCFALFVPLLFALHCVVHAAFALLIYKAGVLRNCKFCSCNKANVFSDAKCNYSPGTSTYLVILCFLARAIRPCTVEDSAFTCAVNYTTVSSPSAALLHSAPFSLPPCYFGG